MADCICGEPTSAHVENAVSTVGTGLVYRVVVVSASARCKELTGGGIRWAGLTKPAPAELHAGMAWDGGPRNWRATVEAERAQAAARAKLTPEQKAVEVLQEASRRARPCPRCKGQGWFLVYHSEDPSAPAVGEKRYCTRCDGTGTDFKIEIYPTVGGPCPKCTPREPPTGRAVPGAPITKLIPFRECEVCGTAWLEGTVKKE